jgi:AAA domain, putative AbiEii toxin, Type IV TA system
MYRDKISSEANQAVQKKIESLSNCRMLFGVKSISSYTKALHVLTISRPPTKVILQEERIEINEKTYLVYFVRDVVNDNFLPNEYYVPIRDGKWLEYNPLPAFESENCRKALSNVSEAKITKMLPPDRLTSWHNDYKLKVKYDIYESEAWVQFAMSNSDTDGMKPDEVKLYCLALLDILNGDVLTQNITILSKNDHSILKSVQHQGKGIVFSEIVIEGNQPDMIYLLHNGANLKTQKEHWRKIKDQYSKVQWHFTTIEDVQRRSFRAYPKWALNQDDLWKKIEKNSTVGNLSLLPEQTQFLKYFKFPSYINGQAGSGKSTMLYYLFANAYFAKCIGEIQGNIIFLTENEALLQYTQKSVIELLHSNTEFNLSIEDISNVDSHFKSFKQFLLNVLPENEKHRFLEDNYLDFSRFKILYEDSNLANHIKSKYSPELVWFTITTYIYGYDFDTQIDSKNYDELMPKEGKYLLTKLMLEGIEKQVVNPFYKKLIDNGYWGKLEIIRFIKQNLEINEKYEVVFCDEAQDFSRVELKFILSLSEYVQYDLSTTEQVPIVFAGDPLQTVNPTGFRAAEVKDLFYQELKEVAGFKLATDKMEYAPDFNYRSSQSIVNVANAVQFYRKKELDATVPKPQKAKRFEDGIDSTLNVFVDFQVVRHNKDLQKKLKYKTIIIPKNADEKEAYLEFYPFLKDFTNVKSAVEAKGIDYEQVVLFGFGAYFIENEVEFNEAYEHRFFYNKLYVAVTRAQSELVIIDSAASEKQFWQPLLDDYANDNWSRYSDIAPDKIQNSICFGANQIADIKMSTPDMALENARKDKERGALDRNAALMRVAASQFLKLGDKKQHFICLALMNELQERWQQAAEYYLKKDVGIEGYEKAASVYWKGHLLDAFKNLSVHSKTEIHRLQLLVIQLIKTGLLEFSELQFLYDKRTKLKEIIDKIAWQSIVFEAFTSFFKNTNDDEKIKMLIYIFDEIAPIKYAELWRLIGQRNYELKRYEDTIRVFDALGEEGNNYIQAHIEVEKRKNNFSKVIVWLDRFAIKAVHPSDKNKIELDMLHFYEANQNEILKQDNEYAKLYIYLAYLCQKPFHPNTIVLAQLIERLFAAQKEILIEAYFKLLKNNSLEAIIFNFVLERWAKKSFQSGQTLAAINDTYRNIALETKIKFYLFTETEIHELLDLPLMIVAGLPKHINSMTICNFRQFKEAKVENLGLFNLVVGDNNIGKTSFLEALLFTPNKKEYLQRLAFAYIERRNVQPDKADHSEGQRLFYKLDKAFLSDYQNNDHESFAIRVAIEGKRTIWRYLIGDATLEGTIETTVPSALERISFVESDMALLQNLPFLDNVKQPFIAYGKGFGIDLATVYYDEIGTKRQLEKGFLENMKIFIPNIERVIADTRSGAIEIRDSDFQEDKPLHQYGEGANKLFRILVLITLHKGHKVLIDEIDAGIHYTRFKAFWKTILQIAKKDNTQIIATTHNEECIRYFTEVLDELGKEYQNASRVVQMKKINQRIKIHGYNFESFNLALERGVEIRGGAGR